MDFDLTEEQSLIVGAVGQIVSRHAADPLPADYAVTSREIEAELVANGFLGGGEEMGLGPIEALLVATELGRLPFAIEAAASGLFGSTLLAGRDIPRPLALALAPATGPIRFLQDKGSALVIGKTDVRLVQIGEGDVEQVNTVFAYPYGKFRRLDLDEAEVLDGVSPQDAMQWWRVAIAAEIGAAGRAALDATVEYVKQRRQFNRAIGSFQAVQHRLGHVASLVHAIEILARRAAVTRLPVDAAVAATMAQLHVGLIYFECAQFHGAIGTTVECALHFWTYKLRALQGELNGVSEQALAAAAGLWPQAIAKQAEVSGAWS